MSSLFNELKRRNVFRVGVAYVVAAWVVAQVADLVLENIGAPAWVMQSLLLVMALGFAAALIVAWAYELTPDGIKRERDVHRDDSVTHETGRRLNIITSGLLVVAIGLVIGDRFLAKNVAPAAQPASTTAPVAGASNAIFENSIAVLPFVNMSSDVEQEYFADGISEEILNALVKAEGLRVSGRTSSFSFKGKDANIQEIGAALNVAHVLEGSVRKQANQVRVTAQLIKADDGFHLWSETYDRPLDNIFEVQDNISQHVTEELLTILRPGEQERLARAMTANMEAYDLFLRGRDYIGKRINNNLAVGITLLQDAVALDPEFAEAWASLAEAEIVSPGYLPVDADAAKARARRHVQTAMDLNPDLVTPYAVLGLIEKDEGRHLEALTALRKAHEIEPNNVLVLRWLGTVWHGLGYFERSREMYAEAFELDPRSRTDAFNLAALEFVEGNLDEAERLFELTAQLQGEPVGGMISDIHFARGDSDSAVNLFMQTHDEIVDKFGAEGIWSRADSETYARGAYTDSELARQAAANLDTMFDPSGNDIWYWQLYEHIKIGSYERVFDTLEQQPSQFSSFSSDFLWMPLERSIEFRQHPRFAALLERKGFVKAWNELGWPDICAPTPGTDGSDGQFTCN